MKRLGTKSLGYEMSESGFSEIDDFIPHYCCRLELRPYLRLYLLSSLYSQIY